MSDFFYCRELQPSDAASKPRTGPNRGDDGLKEKTPGICNDFTRQQYSELVPARQHQAAGDAIQGQSGNGKNQCCTCGGQ